jgi:superfamily I DNA/RNA helicase
MAGDRYDQAKGERQKHVDAVLASAARHKIVVAGPGTGKTHLFKAALKGKQKPLTLTFINALVEDLALELCGISDVKTLHSFAKSILDGGGGARTKIYPRLSTVIKEDAKLLLEKDINFDRLFYNRDDDNEHIKFYRRRKDYYDKHYGYTDIIFAAVKLLELHKDRIPSFDQVVVDEFQDFNKLEVSLLDLLAEKSPTLLAGDDDQALYDFKDASPAHIRERHRDAAPKDGSFVLPYCSRCTRVIVGAVNDVISKAIQHGRLPERIQKPYRYFDDEKKDEESDRSPNLVYVQIHAKQIPWFIEQQINEIAETERAKFGVLTISPIKSQSSSIAAGLESKGFESVELTQSGGADEVTIVDGLKILLDDKESNLGWRIVCGSMLDQKQLTALLLKTEADKNVRICELLEESPRKRVRTLLKTLRSIKAQKTVTDDEFAAVIAAAKIDPRELALNSIRAQIARPSRGNSAVRKIPIKLTTIQSSKGLAEQYVFITNFDDRFFIKAKDKTDISDQDICKFLVALTRAKKKVYLISCEKKDPTFLTWIDQTRIQRLSIQD